MKVKTLWGFVGNGLLLGADSNKVKAGVVFDEADDEYAHTLVGKGLVVELDANGKPRVTNPKETKPSSPSENKTAADKAAADKAAADKAAADKAASEKGAADKSDKEAK
ncbi:hypothetical protein K2E96_26795 [Pseudomonas sp. ERGC3:05]|nr:hypothetical protein [Pseudomonas sp. ERGC3:01]QZC94295.1 hypothetical protein K2E96_26795 [Pseudomonas sp. ERGC3:05]